MKKLWMTVAVMIAYASAALAGEGPVRITIEFPKSGPAPVAHFTWGTGEPAKLTVDRATGAIQMTNVPPEWFTEVKASGVKEPRLRIEYTGAHGTHALVNVQSAAGPTPHPVAAGKRVDFPASGEFEISVVAE